LGRINGIVIAVYVECQNGSPEFCNFKIDFFTSGKLFADRTQKALKFKGVFGFQFFDVVHKDSARCAFEIRGHWLGRIAGHIIGDRKFVQTKFEHRNIWHSIYLGQSGQAEMLMVNAFDGFQISVPTRPGLYKPVLFLTILEQQDGPRLRSGPLVAVNDCFRFDKWRALPSVVCDVENVRKCVRAFRGPIDNADRDGAFPSVVVNGLETAAFYKSGMDSAADTVRKKGKRIEDGALTRPAVAGKER